MKYIILIVLLTLGVWGEQTIPLSPSGIVVTEGFPERPKIEGTILITRLAAMEKKNLLIVGDSNGMIRFLTLDTLQEIKSFKAHDTEITQIVFPEDERFFFTTAKDKTVKQWDAQTCNLMYVYGGHDYTVSYIAVTTDGMKLASGDINMSVILYNTVNHEMTYKFTRDRLQENFIHVPYSKTSDIDNYFYYIGSFLNSIAFDKNGQNLFLLSPYQVTVIDVKQNQIIKRVFPKNKRMNTGEFITTNNPNKIFWKFFLKLIEINTDTLKDNLRSSEIAPLFYKGHDPACTNSSWIDKNESKIVSGCLYGKSLYRYTLERESIMETLTMETPITSNLVFVGEDILVGDNYNTISVIDFESGKVTKKVILDTQPLTISK